MVIHGHQLRWGGRSQRRSASLQVCSLNGTSTAFKRKSAFESSEIRQRATFFCPRGGSGTEAGGRAAFRRRVAGDRGNGARRGAASRSVRVCIRGGGRGGFLAPPIADRPTRDAFVSRRAGRRTNVSLCLGRFLRGHRGRVRPDCGPDDTSLSRRGTSGSHRHEPVLPDGPASRKISFAKLASFQ